MKKFLLAILVIAAAVFTGCSKEDKSDFLSGTTWSFTWFDDDLSDPYSEIRTYTFKSGVVTITVIEEYRNNRTKDLFRGSYTCGGDTVYMTFGDDDYDDEVSIQIGDVWGNEMDVYAEGGNWYLYTLTKQ